MDAKENQQFIPCLPESAPFTPEQRAYLNGFLAGLFSRSSAPAGGSFHYRFFSAHKPATRKSWQNALPKKPANAGLQRPFTNLTNIPPPNSRPTNACSLSRAPSATANLPTTQELFGPLSIALHRNHCGHGSPFVRSVIPTTRSFAASAKTSTPSWNCSAPNGCIPARIATWISKSRSQNGLTKPFQNSETGILRPPGSPNLETTPSPTPPLQNIHAPILFLPCLSRTAN